MIKLIALDIDGTLITSDRRISEHTRAALNEAHRNGCAIVLATGRAFRSLQNVTELLGCPDYAITSSGGGLFRMDGTMIFAQDMAPEQVRAVTKIVNSFGATPELYIQGQAYSSGYQLDNMARWGLPEKNQGYVLGTRVRIEDFDAFIEEKIELIEGMDVLTAPREIREPMRQALSAIPGLAVTSSSPWYIDINTVGVTKASGLAQLGKMLGIGAHEMMAFGDAENDLSMIEYAGIGVAMGNAAEEIKAAADYITADNDHDGIALALERFGVIQKRR